MKQGYLFNMKSNHFNVFQLLCIIGMVILFWSGSAAAVPVDLTTFYADTSVTVASDGSSAVLTEDSSYFSILLSSDPSAGDPGVYLPSNAVSLTFDYVFDEPAGNDDSFYAWIFDPATYSPLQDTYGNYLELNIDASGSGTITWDLSGSSFLGTTVGLEFQLNAYPNDAAYTSTLTISNVEVNVQTNPVPEPATVILFGLGITAMLWYKRQKIMV